MFGQLAVGRDGVDPESSAACRVLADILHLRSAASAAL